MIYNYSILQSNYTIYKKQKIISELISGIVIKRIINFDIKTTMLETVASPASFKESEIKSLIIVIATTLNKSDICIDSILKTVNIDNKLLRNELI